MTKNLWKGMLPALAVVLLMQSCIRDNMMSEEEKANENAKFAMFAQSRAQQKNKKRGSNTAYSTAFRDLYKRYYELHPESAPDFNNPNLTLPDFRYASQVISDSANHTVLFPMVKNGNVVDILTATVDNEESYLQFYKSEKTEFIKTVMNAFSQKKNSKINIAGKDRDSDEMGTGDIEEVIITIPPKQEWPPKKSDECDDLSDYQNDGGCGGPPPSQCPPYQNCGGNTGGGEAQTETPDENCEKVQSNITDPRFKQQFKSILNKGFNSSYETGAFERSAPVGSNLQSSFIPMSNNHCTSDLTLPSNRDGITGLFHIHNEVNCNDDPKFGTKLNVKAPSPQDLYVFFHVIMKQANLYKGSYSEGYFVTMTDWGSYMFKYNSSAWPTNVKGTDLTNWKNWYQEKFQNLEDLQMMNEENVEKLFTQFLKESVKVEGLEVYEITENGATRLEYNPNTKTVTQTPCPTKK